MSNPATAAAPPPGHEAIPLTAEDLAKMSRLFKFLLSVADEQKMVVDETVRNKILLNDIGESVGLVLVLAVWIKNSDKPSTLPGLLARVGDGDDAVLLAIKARALELGKQVLEEVANAAPGNTGNDLRARAGPWLQLAENNLQADDNTRLCKYVAWILSKVYFSNV